MRPHLQIAQAPAGLGCAATAEHSIRVVLAEDHAAMRRSLRLLLDRDADVEVLAEAGDLSTAMRQVHCHQPNVLVLNLRTSNGSSIGAISQLRQQTSDTEIVVLTMEQSPAFAKRAIDAGAIGFVLKDRADDELSQAVRSATRGEEYVSPHVAAGLDSLRRAAGGDGLTPRETELLRLIALGHTSAEIARTLKLPGRAVQTHRRRLHRKLGLATRAELVGYALRRRLIGT